MQKVYCYIDETGQDLATNIFIVGVLTVLNKAKAEIWADKIDALKRSPKWKNTKTKNKVEFLKALAKSNFEFYAYIVSKEKDTPVAELFQQGIVKVLKLFRDKDLFVYVDGKIHRRNLGKIASSLRKSGISPKKVRYMNDEAVSLIRIIDGIVGAVRDYQDGNVVVSKLIKVLLNQNKIYLIK